MVNSKNMSRGHSVGKVRENGKEEMGKTRKRNEE
jgi:hypothetical protein